MSYGAVPEGFSSQVGPEPLGAGCYEASVSGTGFVAFVIEASGTVRELETGVLGDPPDTSR